MASMAMWDVFRRAVLRAVADPQGAFRQRLPRAARDSARRLEHDPALRVQVNLRLGEAVGTWSHVRRELAHGLRQVTPLGRPRDRCRIEGAVGRDLQFIRINGTLVGGLVGLLIHTVSQLVA